MADKAKNTQNIVPEGAEELQEALDELIDFDEILPEDLDKIATAAGGGQAGAASGGGAGFAGASYGDLEDLNHEYPGFPVNSLSRFDVEQDPALGEDDEELDERDGDSDDDNPDQPPVDEPDNEDPDQPNVPDDDPENPVDPEDPQEPVELEGQWFIAHQGNKNSDQAYDLEEGDDMDFNVQVRQAGGYEVLEGETITFTFETFGEAVLGEDYQLSASAKGQTNIVEQPYDNGDGTWSVVIEGSGASTQMASMTFKINVEAISDDVEEGIETLGFDILSVEHNTDDAVIDLGVWETNDEINFNIEDVFAENHQPKGPKFNDPYLEEVDPFVDQPFFADES